MDGLSLAITKGNNAALSLAKTLLTTPTLINIDIKQGALYAIPLDVETNQKSASAEVSESLIIAAGEKTYLADNIAPKPKSWKLTGYINGIPQLEPTNYFKPFVQLYTDILWNWFTNGAVLTFKDGDAHIYQRVVIKDLQTSMQKDCANAMPFTMTLKEIKVMNPGVKDKWEELGDKIGKSLPVAGSIIGAAATLGTTVATVADTDESAEEKTQTAVSNVA